MLSLLHQYSFLSLNILRYNLFQATEHKVFSAASYASTATAATYQWRPVTEKGSKTIPGPALQNNPDLGGKHNKKKRRKINATIRHFQELKNHTYCIQQTMTNQLFGTRDEWWREKLQDPRLVRLSNHYLIFGLNAKTSFLDHFL